MSDRGVGASIPRKEDERFLHGRGEFVPDVQIPGMWHAAFRRSQVAHGRLLKIAAPKGAEGQVFTSADLAGVKPIRIVIIDKSVTDHHAMDTWPAGS